MGKILTIAEAGWNWNGDIGMAKELIWAIADTGADIIKFQLYDIDKIKSEKDDNYYGLKKCQLSRDDMIKLYETSCDAGIEFCASTFDVDRLLWYMETKPKRLKLASRSINDIKLIKSMISTGLPIIASLGSWTGKSFPDFNADFLWCQSRRSILKDGVLNFPDEFNVNGGYSGISDHTIGYRWLIKAINDGATIIEKHVTFDKNLPGWDQPASFTPDEFRRLIDFILFPLSGYKSHSRPNNLEK